MKSTKRLIEHGKWLGERNKGSVNWSRGLSKETDVRVANNAKAISVAIKKKWADPEYRKRNLLGQSKIDQAARSKKISKALTGRKGISPSIEIRKKLSDAIKAQGWKGKTLEERWDKETAERAKRKMIKSSGIHPNKFEVKCMEILESAYPGKFSFTGDGTIWISVKNPDALDPKNRIVVEFNGLHWHLDKYGYKRTEANKRIVETKEAKPYLDAGYKIIFIWEDEV